MDEKRYLARYRDITDEERHVIITMPEEDYITNLSYKENVQRALRNMSDNGGVWVSDKMLVPFHRVLALECYEEHNNGNNNGNGDKSNGDKSNKYYRRHGRRSRGLIKSSDQTNPNQANGSNIVNATPVSTNTTTSQPLSNTL